MSAWLCDAPEVVAIGGLNSVFFQCTGSILEYMLKFGNAKTDAIIKSSYSCEEVGDRFRNTR